VEDLKSPRRSPQSSMRISKWGIVEAWLATSPGRLVLIGLGPRGLQVTMIDPTMGERISVVRDEDPSDAALRAIASFLTY